MTGTDLSSFGLILDIVGASMIWYFVAEINFSDKASFLKGSAVLAVVDPTPEEIRAHKFRVRMSRIGMFVLLVGFSFQLFGANYAP